MLSSKNWKPGSKNWKTKSQRTAGIAAIRRQKADSIECRQVYDLPPLELIITEYQAEVKHCSCGYVNRADFPPGVNHYVQYGPNIKSPP